MRSREEKKELVNKWLSEKELREASEMLNKKELVKVDSTCLDLYSQALDSMGDIASFNEDIFEETKKLSDLFSGEIEELLIRSIYYEFEAKFKPPYGESSEMEEISREVIVDFANNTYAKIETSFLLREIFKKVSLIGEAQKRIQLAKKGVLL